MATTGATMTGAAAMRAKVSSIAERFPDRVASAIFIEAQIELTESKRRVPVDTGALRASGRVLEPERSGTKISVTLSYGGAAVDYAIYVHEDLEAIHPVGQAKYLESVLNESRANMLRRIANRILFNSLR